MPPIRRLLLVLGLVAAFTTAAHYLFQTPEATVSVSDLIQPIKDTETDNESEAALSSYYSESTLTLVETTIPGDRLIHGFALLDRLYLRNGTFFVVTANRTLFPPKRHMIGRPLDVGGVYDLEPTDEVSFLLQLA
jgi:hypothetical protein